MIELFWPTLVYIFSDPFFWPAMGLTTMTGIYIGAIIYDGDTDQVKKGAITIGSLAALMFATNAPRILANNPTSPNPGRPLASIFTNVIVCAFYLLGMVLGVLFVKTARKGKHDK